MVTLEELEQTMGIDQRRKKRRKAKFANQLDSRPWLWKKGQSGNPKGRPKGKTLKEYCRDFLSRMTDEERQDFLNGLPKEIIWQMAEGKPKQDTDITSGGQPITPIYGGISRNNSDQEDISTEEKDKGS